MKKLALTAAAVLVAATSFAGVAPASAASVSLSFGQQDRFIGDQCRIHPNWRGCNDYRGRHGHWSRNDYANWYRWNRPSLGGLGLGLFGFAIGAAVANGINNDRNEVRYSEDDAHIAACQDRFKSYRISTDDYLGYDGYRHPCTL